jgi:hypothetical protein
MKANNHCKPQNQETTFALLPPEVSKFTSQKALQFVVPLMTNEDPGAAHSVTTMMLFPFTKFKLIGCNNLCHQWAESRSNSQGTKSKEQLLTEVVLIDNGVVGCPTAIACKVSDPYQRREIYNIHK